MGLQYGVNITSSDMRNMLEKNDKQQSGVRTWRQLFGNASLGYQGQADSLKSYYSDAMAEAYKSNFAQQNNIVGSGLNVGATQGLLSLNRQNLQETYNNFIKNYGTNLQTAKDTYGAEITDINKGLTERSDNFAKLYNNAYNYLSEELAGSTNGSLQNYLDANNMGWMYEGEGADRKLASWDNIASKFKNGDGGLNKEGIKFFDQVFNARTEGFTKETGDSAKSFGAWLSGKDNDLYNWLGSQDLFNYNLAGTNLGTANITTKRESTDDTYNKFEYADVSGMEEFSKLAMDGSNVLNAFANVETTKKAYEDRIAYDNEIVSRGMRGEGVKRKQTYSQRSSDAYEAIYKENGYKNAQNKATEEWNTYKKGVSEQYTKLESLFRSKIDSNTYSEFVKQNTALLNEYNDVLKRIQESSSPSTELIESYKTVYDEIYKAMYGTLTQKMNQQIKTSGL